MKILVYADSQPKSNMTIDEFISEVKHIYNEYFPNSECFARNLKTMGMEYIQIRWYLSADRSECPHNIRDNDLFWINFNIDIEDNTESGGIYEVRTYDNSTRNTGYMPATITLDVYDKSVLRTPEVSYMAYSRINLPFRKTTGTPEKILATLRKYAQKLHDVVADSLEQGIIPDNREELVRSKL